MDVQAVSALLAALLILAIGASVLLRSRSDKMYTSFAAFTFTVSAWHLCSFIDAATTSPVMRWLALWAAATIPPTAIRFYRIFLSQPSIGGPKRGPRVTLAWTLLAYAALVYSAIVQPIHETLYFQVPFGLYVFGGLYRCVWDMYAQYRATSKRVERTRVSYLALGGFVATTLTLTDVLPRLGVAWPAIGNVLGILYLYFLSQTLFRYRLLDLNELVGKMAVLGTLVVLLSAVYGFLLYWVGGGQRMEGLYLLNALVAAFVILILFEPVRNWLENGINRWLLRQRTELRGRLEAVRRELPGVVDVQDMVSRIITALEESRRVTDAAVYLLDADGAGFDRAGHLGQPPPERLDANAERALLDRVRSGYLDIDQLARELDELGQAPEQRLEGGGFAPAPGLDAKRTALVALKTRVEELQAALIFPLFGSAETEQGPWLLGLFCVRDDRTDSAFDPDDIDTFRQLAIGAARVIESSQAYERVKERDRLAALGEMAAGLAHEIRNPLGAIKGAAQLLMTAEGQQHPHHAENAEFLQIIVEEANRLNNVVTRFLDYARAERPGREGADKVDLNNVVRRTVQLLQKEQLKNIELRVRTDDLLPHVAGDPESLLQVFLNLGQNAIQAMPDGGTLEILTTRRRRSRLGYGQFCEVRFRDTGIGIPRDRLKKLFIPFYTTKQKGTGLGLAISHRIINQHGGTIEVRSTIGQGSTFSVFLPAAEPIPAGKVEDITETGRLSSLSSLATDKPLDHPAEPPAAEAKPEPAAEAKPEPARAAATSSTGTG
jgi:signal transduction histidine kinase